MLAPPGSKGANVNDLGNIFELKVFSFFGEWVIHLQIAHGGLETNGKRGERGNVQGYQEGSIEPKFRCNKILR